MYDWANSVYNLVITTSFFPVYFLALTKSEYGENSVPFLGRTFKNSALYNYAFATAYLIIAFMLPVLSSIADSRGNKKRFMQFFCYMGAISCSGLFFFRGPHPNMLLGIGCFMLAGIGFVGSLVFYNSYLPEIAAPEDQDRISAKGFTYGYIGSTLMQAIGFGLVMYFSSKGDETSGLLYTYLLVGIWWISFAQITFARLPKTIPAVKKNQRSVFKEGFGELNKVWKQVKQMSVLKRFLFSFFFYSMGVQTVFAAATLFGSRVLHLDPQKLIITLVGIQLVAILGATQMARLSAKFGNIKVLISAVILWIVACVAAYQIATMAEQGKNTEYYFYTLAVLVGIVMGGIQSLSRSTYSKLMPATKDTASFFSFYDVTEKFAIVIGVFTFAFIDDLMEMKYSVLSLIVFFSIGLLGLFSVLRMQKKEQSNIA